MVETNFPKLKIIYHKTDKYDGFLGLSGHHLNYQQFQKLLDEPQKIGEKSFKFTKCEGEQLSDFWEKNISHFDSVTRKVKAERMLH